MFRPRYKALSIMLSLATLSAVAFGQKANIANPGTLNYVEGQASIEGQALTSHSVGQAQVDAGQYIATSNGKAEVLLTPGVFLRLGNDTTVKMISPNLTRTEVAVEHGRATIEVDQLYKQNTLLIDQKGGQTQILKNGLYEFNADNSSMRVFNGETNVYPGDNHDTNIKPIKSERKSSTHSQRRPRQPAEVRCKADPGPRRSLRLERPPLAVPRRRQPQSG